MNNSSSFFVVSVFYNKFYKMSIFIEKNYKIISNAQYFDYIVH